ncbi:MAG TPA: patatin-like phospholipase family protein, partial [Isosphaeraceae bacterium]|nr:patatin-like phospholipase family protein [Isosphaeraceae bacterium]
MSTNLPPRPGEPIDDDGVKGHQVLAAELAWIRKRREAAFGEYHTDASSREPHHSLEQPGPAADGSTPQSGSAESVQPPGTISNPRAELPVGALEPDNGVEARRAMEDHPDADGLLVAKRIEAMDMNLAGLAFSGGGIRAGTFAIGFLQGLSTIELLSRFDYLSTVSGGGFAGGWLAAWLFREGQTTDLARPLRNVEMQLAVSRVTQAKARRRFLNDPGGSDGHAHKSLVVDEEPEPIRHLREYSSYMAPRMGLFTADTWTLLMTWSRNVSINMMMLFSAAMLLVLAARGVVYAYANVDLPLISSGPYGYWYRVAAVVGLVVGLAFLAFGFRTNAMAIQEFRGRYQPSAQFRTHFQRPAWEPRVFSAVIRPVLIAALLVTCTILPLLNYLGLGVQDLAMSGASSNSSFWVSVKVWLGEHLQFIGVPNILLHFVVFGGLMMIGALFAGKAAGTTRWSFLGAAFAAG